MALQTGGNFGPFRVVEPLGRGGMASVYRAYEPALDRYVALKVLPTEFLHDPTFAERFRREAKVIARLEHPNIIPIYAFDIENGVPWMAMRLISGGTLSTMLKSGARPTRAQSVAILRGVAEALDYAHAKGVIHRDIKPQNVLLDESQHVYLADFGIAKMVEGAPGLTQTGMISGTPQYMAPEQATGKPVDHRADIYALGIVAYELLTGRVPFVADTPVGVLMKHISDPIPLPSPDQVPEPLMRPLLKAMAKDSAERWSSAGAMVSALESGLAAIPTLHGAGEVDETALLPPPVSGRTAVPPPTVASRTPVPGTVSTLPTVAASGTRTAPTMAYAGAPAGADVGIPATAPPGTVAATPRRSSTPAIAMLVAAFGLFAVAGGMFVAYLILRPSTDKVVTLGSPEPVSVPGGSLSLASPSSTSAVTAPPETTPTPRAINRPVAVLHPTPSVSEPSLGPAEPPSQNVPPIQTLPTPPPAPTPSLGPPGTPFKTNVKIGLGNVVSGPLTLRNTRFRANKGELQAEVEIALAPGDDMTVEFRLELLNSSGQTIATLTGRGDIDEDESGTLRSKQRLTADVLASISSFRITAAPVKN